MNTTMKLNDIAKEIRDIILQKQKEELGLIFLQKEIDFGFITKGNVTIISQSPKQRFLSASKLSGLQPDFHQPDNFTNLSFVPAPE